MHCARAGFRAVLAAAVLHWGFPQALADATPDLRNLSFHPYPAGGAITRPRPAAASLGGARENADGMAPLAGEQDYLDAIRLAEESEGPWAEAVAEHSLALAALHRRAGRREEALAALQKALQVTRVNKGLFDASQIAIVRRIIDTHIDLGDLDEARRQEEYLFYVQRKSYRDGDPRLLAAILEWADWNVDMHLRERASGLTRPYIPRDRHLPGPPLISPRLQHAKDLYRAALSWLHEAGVDDPRVVATERKLAALNYVVEQELDARTPASAGRPDGHPALRDGRDSDSFQFQEGSDALKRAIAYSYKTSERESGNIAERIMELGDWYLLFDRRLDALATYEEALAVLSTTSLSEEEIERIMTPGMPVPLPDVLAIGVDTGRPSAEYKGYIDVEFSLSRFGLAFHPHVIVSSPDTHKAVERELLRTIRDCKFRPRLAKGGEPGDDRIHLRYYYAY